VADDAYNPYAPPVTSEAPPAAPGPARVLWPVYPLALLVAAARSTWVSRALHVMALGQGRSIERVGQAMGYASLAASVVGAPLAGLWGDGRWARAVLVAALVLQAVGTLATLVPASGLPLLVAVQLAVNLPGAVIFPILVGYALRAVSVRGAYLSSMALDAAFGVGGGLAAVGGALLPASRPALLVAAGCALVALLFILPLAPPPRVDRPDDGGDPLAVPDAPVGRRLAAICLLGAFAALSLLLATHSFALVRPVGGELSAVAELVPKAPLLLWLGLPPLAFALAWRPLPLVTSGMLVAGAGGLALAASAPGRTFPLGLVGLAVHNLGRDVLYDSAAPVLIRQLVQPPRVARWYAGYALATALARVGLFAAATPLLREEEGGVPVALPAALLMLCVAVALPWATRAILRARQ
jgi:MFS family permease